MAQNRPLSVSARAKRWGPSERRCEALRILARTGHEGMMEDKLVGTLAYSTGVTRKTAYDDVKTLQAAGLIELLFYPVGRKLALTPFGETEFKRMQGART